MTLQRKQMINWDQFRDDVATYLATAGGEQWRETFAPLLTGVVEAQGERIVAAFGLQFDIQNVLARDWFNDYLLTFSQEVTTTTANDIASLAAQAQAEGWSIDTMADNLGTLFHQYVKGDTTAEDWEFIEARKPQWRRESIARTETIRSSNAGSMEIYKDGGVAEKEWLTAGDSRVREEPFDHVSANGEVVPVDKPFIRTGEQLMFPSDPNGSPGNTILCRCSVLPVLAPI